METKQAKTFELKEDWRNCQWNIIQTDSRVRSATIAIFDDEDDAKLFLSIKTNPETTSECDRLKEELEQVSESLRQMIDINVANEAFDSGEDWRKEHKVTEGESFPHWYMRHHSAEMKSLKEENERLEKEFKEIDKLRIERINQAIQDGLAIQKEVDSLKQLNSELVGYIKDAFIAGMKFIPVDPDHYEEDAMSYTKEVLGFISKANQQK